MRPRVTAAASVVSGPRRSLSPEQRVATF
jgi:hypothetical protein